MKVLVILLQCAAVCLADEDDAYSECLETCSEIGEIHCPMIPAECEEGYELKSCSSGYTAPGDCCPKCVQLEDPYSECLQKCADVTISCPMEPAECEEGYELKSCTTGYIVPGDCCAKCVKAEDSYSECLEKCANVTIHCPMQPAECEEGYELKSCSSGYTVPGDCCDKCVKAEDPYSECLEKCAGVTISCPMEPAECEEGYELKSCSSGYTVPGDCCAKCVKAEDPYSECLEKCANITIYCPMQPAVCEEGYELKSCSSGYTVPGDCCDKCVKAEDPYYECLEKCANITIHCPMQPAECEEGYELKSCSSGYTVPGDCCAKCV